MFQPILIGRSPLRTSCTIDVSSVATPSLPSSSQSVSSQLASNYDMLDMQPDPVMLERQKQEQMMKKQRSEQIRKRQQDDQQRMNMMQEEENQRTQIMDMQN